MTQGFRKYVTFSEPKLAGQASCSNAQLVHNYCTTPSGHERSACPAVAPSLIDLKIDINYNINKAAWKRC
jgi:hypothetical protein